MTETDRELLQLAAKAAGVELEWMTVVHTGEKFISNWHPLTDDGDALRLAVHLKLEVASRDGESRADAIGFPIFYEAHEDDPYAATRRAIVRAAAEIGKAMT